jgi:hypothetical protein
MARFGGLINELEGTGMLSDQTRRNMEATARGLIEKRRADYAVTRERFKEIAEQRKLNPKHVIVRPDHSAPSIDLEKPPTGKGARSPEQIDADIEKVRKELEAHK